MSDKEGKKCKDNNLIDEIYDLKAMLEMQEIINREQEERLSKYNTENRSLVLERKSCTNKLEKMQREINSNLSKISSLEDNVTELEIALKASKKRFDEEHEKVLRLTKDKQNLMQALEKKNHRLQKLKCQLEEERTFYSEEKSRYCIEMKRKRNQSTEVQTDYSNIEDDSNSSKNSSSNSSCDELNRLRALYKHQLITTCLICEKYIRLQKYKTTLLNKLSQTKKDHRKMMCDVMLEFEKCKEEYTAIAENKSNENNSNTITLITNRSAQLAFDNAILKGELMHLNDRLALLRCSENLKDEDTIVNEINNRSKDDMTECSRKKHKRCYRTVTKHKRIGFNKSNGKRVVLSSSSIPESTDNERTNDRNVSYIKTSRRRRNKKLKKRMNKMHSSNGSECAESSICTCSDVTNDNNYNCNRVNMCSSFISYTSENTFIKNSISTVNRRDCTCKATKSFSQSCTLDNKSSNGVKSSTTDTKTCYYEKGEPAYIQVTCDEVRPLVKDGKIVQNCVKKHDNLKADMQEWLARTPVIECSEWSKSVQGMEVMKTESAPEILFMRSMSSFSLTSIKN